MIMTPVETVRGRRKRRRRRWVKLISSLIFGQSWELGSFSIDFVRLLLPGVGRWDGRWRGDGHPPLPPPAVDDSNDRWINRPEYLTVLIIRILKYKLLVKVSCGRSIAILCGSSCILFSISRTWNDWDVLMVLIWWIGPDIQEPDAGCQPEGGGG